MARRDTLAPHTEEAHAVLQDFAQRLLDAKANAPSHLLIGSLSVHVLMPDGSRVLTFCYDTGERYLSIDGLFPV